MLGDSAEENYIETLKKTANQRGKRNYDRSRKVLTPCERVAQSFKWNRQRCGRDPHIIWVLSTGRGYSSLSA